MFPDTVTRSLPWTVAAGGAGAGERVPVRRVPDAGLQWYCSVLLEWVACSFRWCFPSALGGREGQWASSSDPAMYRAVKRTKM